MGFELGTTIGDYQFIDVLESNREETTYKVRNVPAQRYELLRVLSDTTQADHLRSERFQREAKILARLKHPHIVSYCASTKLDGRFVLATELVEGSSLAERLEVGRVSLPDAVRIVWQVLEALECAHAEGVVHRDVSPQRIFLTAEGEVKLSGFYLARSTADPKLTQAGASIGSAHYMSPEQVQATQELDPRSDLYSLGVVFYELVTGHKPFDGSSQFDVMLAQVEGEVKPPSEWDRRIGEELDPVILKALAKKPEERFQSAAEFREALMGVRLGPTHEAGADVESALERKRREARMEQEKAALRADALRRAASPEMISALAGEPLPTPPAPLITGPLRALILFAITAAACAIYFWMFALRS
jgi:serine/threonine-protein kinase